MTTDAGQRLIEDLRELADHVHTPVIDGELMLQAAREIKRLRGVEAAAMSLRTALATLHKTAHAEVSPTYSAALDDAFTIAEIAEAKYDRWFNAASRSTGAADVGEERG